MRTQHRLSLFAAIAVLAGTSGSSLHAGQDSQSSPVLHARGDFTVRTTRESATRYAITKTFSGAMQGESTGVLVGDGSIDAYAAIERFRGTLHGKAGEFVFLHRGYSSENDGMTLDIIIAPNSGTGELKAISGTLSITIEKGRHSYDLTYAVPRP